MLFCGCGSGGGRFVSRFLIRLGFGGGGRGRLRFGGLLSSGLLQFAEGAVGAFVDAMETGFVAGGERNGAGLVHQAAEGERQLMARILGGLAFREVPIHPLSMSDVSIARRRCIRQRQATISVTRSSSTPEPG